MKHRHTKIEHAPISTASLNNVAKNYCASLSKRIRKNRIADDRPNNSKYGFNIPKVVAACSSNVPPYFVCRGRNNHDLQNPHPVLAAAYPPLRGDNTPQYRIPGVKKHYRVGHCAEPHAAHTLLNNMYEWGCPIVISDIRFSLAYRVKNQSVVPYCGTCRLTFPQLKCKQPILTYCMKK